MLILLLSQFFKPLLACTRSRGKCWAAIWLSHCPEPSGRYAKKVMLKTRETKLR